MTVDEARHHHTAGGVDDGGLARPCQVLEPSRRSDLYDDAIANQDGAIHNRIDFAQGLATPWLAVSPQRQQLPGASH